MAESDRADRAAPDTVTIKKYANRRLYNTATSSYVTLDTLCDMVRDGADFVVVDAKSGDDITRQVLTQIIVEQEAKGHNMLPLGFLRQLIQLYGDNAQAFVPGYLDLAMETFARNQGDISKRMNEAFGGMFPVDELEALAERNIALMQRTMEVFAGFPGDERRAAEKPGGGGNADGRAGGNAGGNSGGPSDGEAAVDVGDVLDRLDRMQAQLDALSGRARKEGEGG